MTKRHVKRCLMSLIIREMQIKTAMRYHLTLVRMTIIKESTNNRYWKGYGEKETLLHCWQECKLVQSLWRTAWRFPKRLKIELPYYSTPGHVPQENCNSKRYMLPNVHCNTIYNSQYMEATCMSINRGTDKDNVVHIYNGILLNQKEEWNCAICRYVDGPRDCHTQWSQKVKNKYHLLTHVCGIWKKWYRGTYLKSRNRDTDEEQMGSYQEGKGVVDGINWEIGIDIFTPLCIL